MYVNCQRYDDTPLGRIAHDMLCSNPDDMYNPVLRESARYYKETKEGQSEMCEIWDEVRDEGREEDKILNALNLLRLGVSVEIVSEGCELSLEKVLLLQNSLLV